MGLTRERGDVLVKRGNALGLRLAAEGRALDGDADKLRLVGSGEQERVDDLDGPQALVDLAQVFRDAPDGLLGAAVVEGHSVGLAVVLRGRSDDLAFVGPLHKPAADFEEDDIDAFSEVDFLRLLVAVRPAGQEPLAEITAFSLKLAWGDLLHVGVAVEGNFVDFERAGSAVGALATEF